MFLGVLSSSEVEVKVECLHSLNENGRHELRNFSTGKLLSSRNQSSIISISHISFILMHLLHSSSMTSFRPNSQGWVLDSQTFSIKHNFQRNQRTSIVHAAISQHVLLFFNPSSASSTSRFHDMMNSDSVHFPTCFLPSFQPQRDQPCHGRTLLRN